MQRLLVFATLTVLTLVGCGGSSDGERREKIYDVKGKVLGVDKATSVVTLDHEDVEGLMKAMRMEFKVADPKLLHHLSIGDAVEGKLAARSTGFLLIELQKR